MKPDKTSLDDELKSIELEVARQQEELIEQAKQRKLGVVYHTYEENFGLLITLADRLKASKDLEALRDIAQTIETLVIRYNIETSEETQIPLETPATEGTEKPEGTYQIYIELRDKGKRTHEEAKEIATRDYHIKSLKGFRRWSSAYSKRKKLLERIETEESPQQIEELPLEIVEKIRNKNYTTQDFIFDVESGNIKEEYLRATYFQLGMRTNYRSLKVGVCAKLRSIERKLKASGKNLMEYQNGGGRRLEVGFDKAGKFYSKRIEDAVKEHNLDGKN